MEPELTALAATAATTVVQALTTTAWEQARNAVGGLWRRAHPDRAETVEADLVEARREALAAREAGDDQAEQDLVGEWQSRLRRLLATDPQLAGELRELVEQLRPALPDGGTRLGQVEMHARASEQGRVYQAGRDQHISD